MTTRGRPPGQPKTGGKQVGSLNRQARQELTEKLAGDLLWAYEQLGNREWLLAFARENPIEFLRLGLSRLFPAPAKEDPDVQLNQQINVGNLSDFEAARKIAFALAKGLHSQKAEPAIEAERVLTPQEACRPEPRWQPPDDMPTGPSLSSEELAALVKAQEAKEWQQVTLETYGGSSAEQGRKRKLL
ncbi:MAG: hypothetical protein A2Y50_07290 [Pseudomonadales bacterium RIFCSPLOWO2_12_59_9]|nr:MAG: hypothetical protein A2Y50_07290 [Pseudomonadales bacterium RIFCSPLOWO2_12_59_9]